MALPEPEIALETQGLGHLREGRAEPAAWQFLLGARLALARGDLVRSARCHAAATHALEGLTPEAGLTANLLLIESELAAEAGHFEPSARLSMQAIDAFKRAGDHDGVIAVWMARGERALRAGNLDAAEEIFGELLPRLDHQGAHESGFWLRLRLAAAMAAAGRRIDAVAVLVRAMELTEPGSSQRMAGAAEGMRIWLDSDRAADALELGLTVLDAPASSARQLHAEVMVLCAVALQKLGQPEDAASFTARALGFESPGLSEARRRLGAS